MMDDKLVRMSHAISAAKTGADDWDGGCNIERDRYIEKAFADIPAVDAVEVVHACWKRVHDDVCYWSECSHCGGEMPLNRYRREWESAVCPSCGARMDGRRGDGDGDEGI